MMVYEYGPDVVNGMQDGKKIKWNDTTTTSRIHILAEHEPIGTQRLITEDVIEELNKVPDIIRKYIHIIVLAPFTHPKQDYFNKRMGKEGAAFASGDYVNRQITIYAIPEERNILKETLANHMTLSHEAGHIIDGNIQPNMEFFAYTPQWTKAMCEDTRIEHITPDLPYYFVSRNAEELKSLREDFADSVMYFSSKIYNEFLKINFPNRFKILEDVLNGR